MEFIILPGYTVILPVEPVEQIHVKPLYAAALNVIRNISIGSLMMPLLTWGTSNVDPGRVADASSLLTSFRTIAGSIGSAVFVGIMNIVSENSEAVYGGSALMHGMNISFMWMTVGSLVLLAISIFGTGRQRRRIAE